MSLLDIMLKGIGYPGTVDASVDGPESRRLVAWLEDTKIRNMKKEERAGLRDVASGGWEAALRSYLEGLECPFEYTPETRAQVLEWLLSYATMLEYQDSRDAITRARAAAAAPREAVLEDSGLPEVAQGVERVARSLGITSSGTVDQINSIRNLIAAKKGAGDLKLTADPDSGCFDAGFETGDAPLDRAVRVLRMLFVKDLRDLQTSIDETIVAAQEFTANPKTDTRQGKVGR